MVVAKKTAVKKAVVKKAVAKVGASLKDVKSPKGVKARTVKPVKIEAKKKGGKKPCPKPKPRGRPRKDIDG